MESVSQRLFQALTRKRSPILAEVNSRLLDGLGNLLHSLLERRNSRRRDQSDLPDLGGPEVTSVIATLFDRCKLLGDDAGKRSIHDSSLSGYGANIDNAPMASAEGATSVVGDIVRDGADMATGSDSPVEQSAATGAAASARPHHSPTKIAGAA